MTRHGVLRIAALGAAALLAGCAAQEIASNEQVLAASGFRVLPANTPKRVASLNRLPPDELVMTQHHGHPVWLYADPRRCHCLYVGDRQAYQHFEKLKLRQRIAQENLEAAQMEEMNWDWGMWGPWPPWGPGF